VPLTVARDDLPLGTGSLQLFVEHDPEQHYFTLLESRRAEFKRLAMLDILCNNADRKGGHCLLGPAGHLWAVDHGLAFHPEPKLRTVIWDFAGEPLPARDRPAITAVAERLAAGEEPLRSELADLLSENELDALQRRAEAMQQPGVFPHPESSWSFPWPLV